MVGPGGRTEGSETWLQLEALDSHVTRERQDGIMPVISVITRLGKAGRTDHTDQLHSSRIPFVYIRRGSLEVCSDSSWLFSSCYPTDI
jgi:hypothetical protein